MPQNPRISLEEKYRNTDGNQEKFRKYRHGRLLADQNAEPRGDLALGNQLHSSQNSGGLLFLQRVQFSECYLLRCWVMYPTDRLFDTIATGGDIAMDTPYALFCVIDFVAAADARHNAVLALRPMPVTCSTLI